jgi:hypothetical protein
MLWFRNKLAEQFAVECSQLRGELARETAKRVAAETLAEERRIQADRAHDYALEAQRALDEVVRGRLLSLDVVNTKLLEAMAPEKTPPNPKNFNPLPPKPNPRRQHREYADRVIKAILAKKKTPPAPEVKTPVQ